jgi:hypothetical protein
MKKVVGFLGFDFFMGFGGFGMPMGFARFDV